MADLDFEQFNRVARSVKPTDSSTVWTPRPPQWTLHQGTIAGADNINNVAHLQLNDATAPVAEGVRVLQHYTAGSQPTAGETTWFLYNGRTALLVGRQEVPSPTVVFS